ncbi:hypothetical protein [Rhizobium leguminosarum]|uniref:hypothetical protein n=1 Tax=Rhizobium leguminosarum TaxID=384 RepID=UPI003F9C1E92
MSLGPVGCLLVWLPCISLVLAPPSLGQTLTPSAGQLSIGVRSDARPFSYELPPHTVDSDATRGPLSRNGYGGYMIRICDAVLAEMLVEPDISKHLMMEQIKIYDIDKEYRILKKNADQARARTADLKAAQDKTVGSSGADTNEAQEEQEIRNPPEPSASRFIDLGIKYDILCDPATITNDRRQVIVSPPLFLTGISYLTPKGAPVPGEACGDLDPAPVKPADKQPPQNGTETTGNSTKQKVPRPALIGLVGGTTAESRGLQALIDAREMPKFEEQLVKQLRKEPGKPACEHGMLVRPYPNHEEAARAFCRGDAFHYYVGDLEIIRTYVGAIPGCKFDNGVVTYTNDRYGIFGRAIGDRNKPGEAESRPTVSSELPQSGLDPVLRAAPDIVERRLLVARFFEILSQKVVFNPSILDKAYNDAFPNLPQSRKLKLFYWSIRGERLPDTTEPDGGQNQKAGAQNGAAAQADKTTGQ